jgi:ppGpp synthetase/RelA/SpoT-type nucleotidyltranferase
MDPTLLEREYRAIQPRASHVATELEQQLVRLLHRHDITLGVPIEKRIKDWSSIVAKLERKGLAPASITELHDLLGFRIILMFQRDVNVVCKLIAENFAIIHAENKLDSLQEREFGYSSVHCAIRVSDNSSIGADAKDLIAEIQVRTLAQHIWAAVSHTLQYKQEDSVPPSVRRSINRVAALLETVDVEFERILDERQIYRTTVPANDDDQLNVDLLAKILDKSIPRKFKRRFSQYDGLLAQLKQSGIFTVKQLRGLIGQHLDAAVRGQHRFKDELTFGAVELIIFCLVKLRRETASPSTAGGRR